MRRIRKRHALGVVVLAAVVAAFAVPAATVRAGALASNKGEGRLNVIEWPYYTDKSFAKPFERQTGCIIHRKDAATSNDMVAWMRQNGGGGGGQWDLVSASGDASLRLIYGGDVQPVNVHQIPSWKNFIKIFKSPAHNTVKGVHYGVSVQWGPNTLIYNTKVFKKKPTTWGVIYSKKYKGKITVPNNPIQIADAALYLMKTKPSLGIKDPYELTQSQLAAAGALLVRQKGLLKDYWNSEAQEIQDFKSKNVVVGAGWPSQTLQLQAAKAPIKETIPKEGATGWADTWMLAKRAPHPHCAMLWMKYVTTPKVEAKQALVFGETPVNPLACKYMNRIQKGSCAAYHLNQPLSYYKTIHFWKTPIAKCGWKNGTDCMDYNAWQQAWTQIQG